jgi:hypothetical protein
MILTISILYCKCLYFLRHIILFANIDVFRHILVVDISRISKEYYGFEGVYFLIYVVKVNKV